MDICFWWLKHQKLYTIGQIISNGDLWGDGPRKSNTNIYMGHNISILWARYA